MANTISLPPDVYILLRERAQQEHTSPDTLAELAVRRYLGSNQQDWRTSFESLLAKVQSRTAAFASEEIEADIAAAAEEVKERRRARRAGCYERLGFGIY
jgi:hypothetical protein